MRRIKNKIFRFLLSYSDKVKVRYYIDFFYFSVGFFISSFLALIISIKVNSGLSKVELGEFSYNKAALEISSHILTLTIYRSYLRFNVKGVSLVLRRFVKLITRVAMVGLGLIAYYLNENFLSILFVFFVLFEEQMYLNRSMMVIKRVNFLKIGAASITLATVYVLERLNFLSSEMAIFAYGLGFMVSLLFIKSKFEINDDVGELTRKTILLFSLPALGAILVKLSLDFSGQYMLKKVFDFEEVSKFAIGLRVALAVKLFSSLLIMFYPVVYFREIEKKNKAFIYKLRLGMIGLMSIVCTAAILLAKPLYILMGASNYLEYVQIFKIIVISEFIFIVGNFSATYLAYALKTHISLLIFTAGAVLNIVILAAFLGSKGILVAPYAVLASNLLILSLQLVTAVRWEHKYLTN